MSEFVDEIIEFLKPKAENMAYDELGFLNISLQNRTIVLVEIDTLDSIEVSLEYFFDRKNNEPKTTFIWEDIWNTKKEIVKSRLHSILNTTHTIHARDTSIVKLNTPVFRKFIENNHLNVFTKSKYRYGLVYKYQIVAVASFSKSCPIHRANEIYRSHELIRYCSLKNLTVVGGLSKIVEHFVKEQAPDDIVTYLDRDWSLGTGYDNIGFKPIELRKPINFFINKKTFERVYAHKQKDEFSTSDFISVYNSGSQKLLLDLKNG